jgi:hypothetical protein
MQVYIVSPEGSNLTFVYNNDDASLVNVYPRVWYPHIEDAINQKVSIRSCNGALSREWRVMQADFSIDRCDPPLATDTFENFVFSLTRHFLGEITLNK